jgi:hypothetical protein
MHCATGSTIWTRRRRESRTRLNPGTAIFERSRESSRRERVVGAALVTDADQAQAERKVKIELADACTLKQILAGLPMGGALSCGHDPGLNDLVVNVTVPVLRYSSTPRTRRVPCWSMRARFECSAAGRC